MFASTPTSLTSGPLEGRQVRLEPLGPQHLDGLWAAAAVPRESFVWASLPDSPEEMRRYLETAVAVADAGAAVPFATLEASTGRVVGCTRFANLEHQQLPVTGEAVGVRPWLVEIGWTWLTPSAQRTGINTEAKLLMLSHAFEAWRLGRVVLKTHEENAVSRAAIERIGGKLDGFRTVHYPGGTSQPRAWYSIGAADWPRCKEHLQARLRRG